MPNPERTPRFAPPSEEAKVAQPPASSTKNEAARVTVVGPKGELPIEAARRSNGQAPYVSPKGSAKEKKLKDLAQEHDDIAAIEAIVIPERFERKHFIVPSRLPKIRDILKTNLISDPHATKPPFPGSDINVYTTYTLHLDSQKLTLTLTAKDDKLQPRFKLRIRTYEPRETDTKNPNVALQIKRRTPQGWVVKTETKLSWEEYHKNIMWIGEDPGRITPLNPNDSKQTKNLALFSKLVRELGAAPTLIVGYERESYLKPPEHYNFGAREFVAKPFYSRATIDGNLRYLVSTERFPRDPIAWSMPSKDEFSPYGIRKLWRTIHTELDVHGYSNSCYVLELKGMPEQAETWITALENQLRTPYQDGFSKVYQALVQEMETLGEHRDPWGCLYATTRPILRRAALMSYRSQFRRHMILSGRSEASGS